MRRLAPRGSLIESERRPVSLPNPVRIADTGPARVGHDRRMPATQLTRSEWALRVADIASTLRDRWSLEILPAFETGGQAAWVAPVRTNAGDAAVLKIGWPHFEADDEAKGLAFWAGDGAVQLLDSAVIGGVAALLVERCEPGTSLADTVASAEQDVIVAGLLSRLWREPTADTSFRPLGEMCAAWAASARPRVDRTPGLDRALLHAGIDLFAELPLSAERGVVLFTDLHAGNVLSAEREAWLAIDPKPYVGDPTYDAIQHLLNSDRLHTGPIGLIDCVAGLLDLDPFRLGRWLFARCCVDAVHDPALQRVARQIATKIVTDV
jgi:streptomycin 6-kinase